MQIRQRVGYVPERPTLYEWMTVEEIGWFTAGFLSPTASCPSTPGWPPQFGLPPRKKLKALSKGMRAKVALALALAHRPELLMLDEPTSGLDAMVRREFLESMVDRAAQGKTVFLSSHQIGEVERVADVVAILRRGKLLLVEPLDELKARVRRVDHHAEGRRGRRRRRAAVILSQRFKARQWQALVRDAGDEQLAALAAHEAVETSRSTRAGLEDIFMAYMQGNGEQDRPSRDARGKPSAGGTTAMNRSIFRRLVWKEYRLQRALWIAMALLTAILLFLFHVVRAERDRAVRWQLSAGLALPALYCLGCGATLFAGEREAGTYEFQRSLPVGAGTVFAAKFLFALVSAAVMFGLVGVALALLYPGSAVDPSEYPSATPWRSGTGCRCSAWNCCSGPRSSRCCCGACWWRPCLAWRSGR